MLPKALIISTCLDSAGPIFGRVFEGVAQRQWQTWASIRPEPPLRFDAQLIVACLDSPTAEALPILRLLHQEPLPVPLLAVLPENCGREIVQLVSDIAADFLFWPPREDELKLRASRLLGKQPVQLEQIGHALREELGLRQLVGNHPAFLRAVEQALLFCNSDAPVLITGETGTGKELFAHAIHSLSARRDGPFIPVDCGTLPEHLAENELFGHRRGAYTDAHTDHKGLAAMADGGTFFLDEIDALSPANQSKLLRFLEEGTFRALGSDRISHASTRIIAATNRPIEEAVHARQFRSDLYFRINVLRLELPPLRKRHGDISILARHFLQIECRNGPGPKTLSASALRKLESYHWPGNVRELLNTIQCAIVCCTGHQILSEHIVLTANSATSEVAVTAGATFRSAKRSVIEKFEHDYVEDLMVRFHGNVTRAAQEAGKERRAFGRLIKKYGITNSTTHQDGGPKAGQS